VLVPDQIGFGKSSKPSADLHFDTLARNTIAMLASADRQGRYRRASMGGMIAVPHRAPPIRTGSSICCLAAPIGLEDYRGSISPRDSDRKNYGTRRTTDRRRLPQAARDQLFAETAPDQSRRSSTRGFNIRAARNIRAGCAPLSIRRR